MFTQGKHHPLSPYALFWQLNWLPLLLILPRQEADELMPISKSDLRLPDNDDPDDGFGDVVKGNPCHDISLGRNFPLKTGVPVQPLLSSLPIYLDIISVITACNCCHHDCHNHHHPHSHRQHNHPHNHHPHHHPQRRHHHHHNDCMSSQSKVRCNLYL